MGSVQGPIVLKVSTKEVRDIIRHLEKLGPHSSGSLKRVVGAQVKLPEEVLIKRAACTTARNSSLVAF